MAANHSNDIGVRGFVNFHLVANTMKASIVWAFCQQRFFGHKCTQPGGISQILKRLAHDGGRWSILFTLGLKISHQF